MSELAVLTVEKLNFYINSVFNAESLLHDINVEGETSGACCVGGHLYFTLKDAKAQIKVVFFNCRDAYIPADGEKILVRGRVDFFAKNGTVNIKAVEIIPSGLGAEYAKLAQLKEKLQKEGLFNAEFKKPIPERPRRVAVITSIKGAALHDFISTVRARNNLIDIAAIDVRVQGESCADDVLTALKNADGAKFDVIVLTRGGGSFEDLKGFNDERIARLIFAMQTPIITAIGHEIDKSICDFVSDYSAITPTAAAEKIAFSIADIKNYTLKLLYTVQDAVETNYRRGFERIRSASACIKNSADLFLLTERGRVISSMNALRSCVNASLAAKSNEFNALASVLEEVNPMKIFSKGYFRVAKDEKIVFDFKDIAVNDDIEIYGADAKISARVTKKERK